MKNRIDRDIMIIPKRIIQKDLEKMEKTAETCKACSGTGFQRLGHHDIDYKPCFVCKGLGLFAKVNI